MLAARLHVQEECRKEGDLTYGVQEHVMGNCAFALPAVAATLTLDCKAEEASLGIGGAVGGFWCYWPLESRRKMRCEVSCLPGRLLSR